MKPMLIDLLCIAGLFALAFIFGYESGRREKNWLVSARAARDLIERAAEPGEPSE